MITSTGNPRIRSVAALMKKPKARREEKCFIVEGPKMFAELPADMRREVYVSESFLSQKQKGLLEGCAYETVSDDVMSYMSGTQTPQGILAVAEQLSYRLEDVLMHREPGRARHLLFLETIQDPGNLGTILRASEGAGVTGVIMSDETADVYNPKVIRSTMGSVFRVPFVYVPDLCSALETARKEGIRLFAAYLKGSVDYDREDYTGDIGFMIGNEAAGLTERAVKLADCRIKIPMSGRVESLNAAVASSILMFEAARQRKNRNC